MPKDAKTSGPARKIGPLPLYGWVAAGGATFLVYTLYRRHAANVAASAAQGTTGGGSTGVVLPQVLTTGGTTTIAASTQTLAQWRQAVLAQMTNPKGGNIGLAQATLVLNDYLAGHPIPYQYRNAAQALQNVLSNVGIAPGLPFRNVTLASAPIPVTATHTPSETVVAVSAPSPNRPPVAVTRPTRTPVAGARGGAVSSNPIARATAQLFNPNRTAPFRQGPPPPNQAITYPAKGHPTRPAPPPKQTSGVNLSPVALYYDLANLFA